MVAIVEEKSRSSVPAECVARLLSGPRRGRDHEEVRSHDLARVIPQEGRPGRLATHGTGSAVAALPNRTPHIDVKWRKRWGQPVRRNASRSRVYRRHCLGAQVARSSVHMRASIETNARRSEPTGPAPPLEYRRRMQEPEPVYHSGPTEGVSHENDGDIVDCGELSDGGRRTGASASNAGAWRGASLADRTWRPSAARCEVRRVPGDELQEPASRACRRSGREARTGWHSNTDKS